MSRKPAPFRVYKSSDRGWVLRQMHSPWAQIPCFKSAAEAIDHAYRRWPWWP